MLNSAAVLIENQLKPTECKDKIKSVEIILCQIYTLLLKQFNFRTVLRHLFNHK